MFHLARQYRLDVAAISFGAFIAGVVFAGGLRAADIPIALAISLISFNYIYSFNSIEDREIDAVNKPGRPLPSGDISLKSARLYVTLLLIGSIVYPFFVTRSPLSLALFLALPALGWAYSSSPVRLKTKLVPATISIAMMYVLPIAIALSLRPEAWKPAHPYLLAYCFVLTLGLVPLKDIEDVEGDQSGGSQNWMAVVGLKRLLTISTLVVCASILVALPSNVGAAGSVILITLSASILLLIAAFVITRLPAAQLYRSILVLIALLGTVFFVYSLWHGGSL